MSGNCEIKSENQGRLVLLGIDFDELGHEDIRSGFIRRMV